MPKKLNSTRTKNILSRIEAYGDIEIVGFGDCILSEPICNWPRCDVLIAYFSYGYPMDKVIEYVDRYQPSLINTVKEQKILRDRLKVKQMLIDQNIPTPRFAVLDRTDPNHVFFHSLLLFHYSSVFHFSGDRQSLNMTIK